MWDDDPKYNHNDKGARFAAASEMWLRFGAEDALETVKSMIFEEKLDEVNDIKTVTTGSWVNISRYDLIELAMDEETPEDIRNHSEDIIVRCAQEYLVPRAEKDGHKVVTALDEYYWGHNANLAEKTHILAMASKLVDDEVKKEKFMEVARDQWHWLMGRNPNSYAMATRVGKGATAFYHMEWGPYSPPPPGFAIGGPNASNLPQLAPGAPAKALLWDNPEKTRVGTPPHAMFHWKQEDIWDGGFIEEGSYEEGWWAVTETDLLYSADFVLAGIAIR